MTGLRAALVQLSVGDDPAANLPVTRALIHQAADAGAQFVLTPECTNLISSDRAHQAAVLTTEAEDATLAALRQDAAARGIWLLIGSLALKADEGDHFANRSLLIDPQGQIAARYDKIHMFDVDVSETERYRESAAYRPGDRAVLASQPFGGLGMTICYDLRFPQLFRILAQAGAQVIAVPAAFNDTTGAAHWESLLRARAIENTCYILAPAQCGSHGDHDGRPRRTHGHSLAVSPWGEVLADGGTEPGITLVTLDPDLVAKARARVPSLRHDRPFEAPQ